MKKIYLIMSMLIFILNTTYGQQIPPASAIDAGSYSGDFSYNDTKNTSSYPSGSLYYKFTIITPASVIVSNCGSNIANSSAIHTTFLSVYSSTGKLIIDSDLFMKGPGAICPDNPRLGFIETDLLAPGTYYVQVKWSGNGSVRTAIESSLGLGVVDDTFGCSMINPIHLGTISSSYLDTLTRTTSRFCKETYYKFTTSEVMNINFSAVGLISMSIDIRLLNSSGVLFGENSSFNAVLSIKTLTPGDYYIVVNGNPHGGIKTTITASPVEIKTDRILSKDQNYIFTVVPRIASSNINNLTPDNSLQTVQYFDGLGRPTQTVQINANPQKYDLVSNKEYDALGRESNDWLPVTAPYNNGAFLKIDNFKTRASITYVDDKKPYSVPTYEASPLSRITEQYGPGQDWQSKDKKVKTEYLGNNTSYICKWYKSIDDKKIINISRTSATANYAASQLYVTKLTDEDGKISYEFKDKIGQTVLTRQMEGTTVHDTYYVYDSYGNLRAVLPPMAADNLSSGTWTDVNNTYLQQYAYLYKYDERNRCIAKKLPGSGWIYNIYDKADRLIFTQDSVQRVRKEWTFTVPDIYGRTVLTGTCTNTLNYLSQPGYTVLATRTNTTNTYKGCIITGVTLTGLKIISVNYYDDYGFMGKNDIPSSTDTNFRFETLTGYGTQYTTSQKGLQTGSLTGVFEESGTLTYIPTVMYYDYRGRCIQVKSKNHLSGGLEKEYIGYNFAGQPERKRHVHSATNKSTQTEIYTYSYDHAGRLIKTEHQLQVGNTQNAKVTLAEQAYDEFGRLKTKKLHGSNTNPLSYTYNIRSWLTGISSTRFTQNLYYNTGNGTLCYNGNISSTTWKAGTETATRGYKFIYDGLNRLT